MVRLFPLENSLRFPRTPALYLSLRQQIAVILQYENPTKIYIASFQMTLELGYLKGGYINFGFAVLDFLLQDCCIVDFRTVVHK